MLLDCEMTPEALRLFQLAYKFQLKGEYNEAIFYYQRSLDIEATAEGHTFLGWSYSCIDRYEDAIEECKLAIEIDPDYGNPYNDIGCYLLELDRLDEAVCWFEDARNARRYATPEYAYVNLARVYEQQGLWPLAIREYREALRYNPDYSPAVASLNELQARVN
ncbi:MAG: tetratricopeptide repeat protein [Calditrichia bacterium]